MKSQDRRWELIFKDINKTITQEEQAELLSLQQEVWKTTKLYNYRKVKPGELVEDRDR